MHRIMSGAAVHMQEGEALLHTDSLALRSQSVVQGHRLVRRQQLRAHVHAISRSNALRRLANRLQRACNARVIHAAHINPQGNLSRHNIYRARVYIDYANRTHSTVGFFVCRRLVHRQNQLRRTHERIPTHPHRRSAAMVGHALNMQLKACRRSNIMHNADRLARLLQHLALLDMQLGKAFIRALAKHSVLIRRRLAAPFLKRLDKADIALLRAAGKLLRRCAAGQKLAAHRRIAKAARLLRTENNHLDAALQLLVLQHIQRLQRTDNAAHAVIGTAVDNTV